MIMFEPMQFPPCPPPPGSDYAAWGAYHVNKRCYEEAEVQRNKEAVRYLVILMIPYIALAVFTIAIFIRA